MGLLIPAASAPGHLLAGDLFDRPEAPLTFGLERTVLGNAQFARLFVHPLLRSDLQNDVKPIVDYEAVEVRASAALSRGGAWLRLDLPFMVVGYDDAYAPKISPGQRRSFHNRGLGDLRAELGLKVPKLPLRLKLARDFATGETPYGLENPHLATGSGLSSWEPSAELRGSLWILDGSLEAGASRRGAVELNGPYFGNKLYQSGRIQAGDYGRAEFRLRARLYRDADHEVYFGAGWLYLGAWTETLDGRPAPGFRTSPVQAGLVDLKLRFGREFRFGLRDFIYPLEFREAVFTIPDNVLSLSLELGAP